MTHLNNSVNPMKPEAQRIAIAEVCGWTITPCGRMWTLDPAGLSGPFRTLEQLPDYLNSLDAMHEAEAIIADKVGQSLYAEELIIVLNRDHDGEHRFLGASQYYLAHATAAQKAEAFLKTFRLWVDD